jgi:hypothetical protein
MRRHGRQSEITRPFSKYAKRNDENKEIKVWGQQKGNLFSIFPCMKKEKAQAKSKNIPREHVVKGKKGLCVGDTALVMQLNFREEYKLGLKETRNICSCPVWV